MPESLFDIFGDHHNRQIAKKNVSRQPLTNIENMGKTVSSGSIKLNEPLKKGAEPMKKGIEPKKSFLSNTGKALQQSTPGRKVFTPRASNVASMIYSDDNDYGFKMEEVEFTKPTYRKDNFKELFDFVIYDDDIHVLDEEQAPPTPPPMTRNYSAEHLLEYQDEFFKDYSIDSLNDDDDLGLPDLY